MALHRFRGAIRSTWWCTCTRSFEPPPRVRRAAKGETVRLRRDRQGCDACPMRAPVEILIVEDHTMVAEGLRLAAGMAERKSGRVRKERFRTIRLRLAPYN